MLHIRKFDSSIQTKILFNKNDYSNSISKINAITWSLKFNDILIQHNFR